MALKAAILDDYQNVAMTVADWSPVKKDVELKVYDKPLGGPDKVVAALQGLRDRVPDARAHFVRRRHHQCAAQAQADRDLRPAQRRDRRRGSQRARRRGQRHGVARPSDRGIDLRADARTGAQDRPRECAAEGRRSVAIDARHRPLRQDARHHRPRQARLAGGPDRQCARHEGDRLEPESDGGEWRKRTAPRW